MIWPRRKKNKQLQQQYQLYWNTLHELNKAPEIIDYCYFLLILCMLTNYYDDDDGEEEKWTMKCTAITLQAHYSHNSKMGTE